MFKIKHVKSIYFIILRRCTHQDKPTQPNKVEKQNLSQQNIYKGFTEINFQ